MLFQIKIESGDSLAKNWNCIDCNKLIWNRYTRCQSCAKTGKLNNRFENGLKGKDNPNWQGGISMDKHTYNFKKKLSPTIRRIMPRCQQCYTDKDLVVHHIDYNKRNDQTNNLITLCRSCNAKVNFHKENYRLLLSYKREKGMIKL